MLPSVVPSGMCRPANSGRASRAGTETSRSGRNTHYRLTPGALGEALAWIERVGAEWDERLAALRGHLSGAP